MYFVSFIIDRLEAPTTLSIFALAEASPMCALKVALKIA